MSYDLSLEDLSAYFHMPINDVAKELGVCATVLKKICRKNGIVRWPHRKVKSVNKMIDALECIIPQNESEEMELEKQIQGLKEKRQYILRNPNVSYKTVVPKYCVSSCQMRVQKAASIGALREPKDGDLSEFLKGVRSVKEAPIAVGRKRSRPDEHSPSRGKVTPVDPHQEEDAVSVLLGFLGQSPDKAHSPASRSPVQVQSQPAPHTLPTRETIRAMQSMVQAQRRDGHIPLSAHADAMDVEGTQRPTFGNRSLSDSAEVVNVIQGLPSMQMKNQESVSIPSWKASNPDADVHVAKRQKVFDASEAPFVTLPKIQSFSPFGATENPLDSRVVPTISRSPPYAATHPMMQ